MEGPGRGGGVGNQSEGMRDSSGAGPTMCACMQSLCSVYEPETLTPGPVPHTKT